METLILVAGLGLISGIVGGASYVIADNTPGNLGIAVLLTATATAVLVSVAVFKVFGRAAGWSYVVLVLLGVVPGYLLAVLPFVKHR